MSPDSIFSFANTLAMTGWAALLASPWLPKLSDAIAGLVIPALFAVAYAGLIAAFWAGAQGGFEGLDDVAKLFETRELLLAGWLHYLAFDLFVGAWIARTARASGIAFWMVVPCFVLTFLFGPAGFLLFTVLRGALRRPRAATI